jgi:hypothetical protein
MNSKAINFGRKLLKPSEFEDEYALIADGDCLSPAIEHDAVVAASKIERPNVGDFVAIWFKPEFVKAGQHQAVVKLLSQQLPPSLSFEPGSNVEPAVVVYQLNPTRRFVFKAEAIEAVHRVIGTFAKSKGPGGRHDWADMKPLGNVLLDCEVVQRRSEIVYK